MKETKIAKVMRVVGYLSIFLIGFGLGGYLI